MVLKLPLCRDRDSALRPAARPTFQCVDSLTAPAMLQLYALSSAAIKHRLWRSSCYLIYRPRTSDRHLRDSLRDSG